MKKSEWLFIGIIIIFTIIMFGYSFSLPKPYDIKVPGPAFFPRIVLVGLFLFCGLFILLRLLKIHQAPSTKDPSMIKLIRCMFLTVIYILIIPHLGYCVTTFIFMVSLLWIFNVKRIAHLITIPLGFTVIIYMVFYHFLMVDLPKGFVGI